MQQGMKLGKLVQVRYDVGAKGVANTERCTGEARLSRPLPFLCAAVPYSLPSK